jgi:hypothetical protein
MSSVNKKLSSDDLFHDFFGEDYKVDYPEPVTPQDFIMSTSTLKPSDKSKKKVVFSEPANIKCDKEKTPKFVRIDVKTKKEIKKVPFFGYMQPNVVDGHIVKNDDKSVYCKNTSYPYLTWDNSKYKYCCSETPDTLEKKLKHCKDVLYHMFTGISNHKKKNPGRSTDQQFSNTIKLYMNIFRQIMNKQLQEQIQETLTSEQTPEQKQQISEFRQASDKAIETEKKKLTDLYTSNLTEDTELSTPEESKLRKFLLELKTITPENYIPSDRLKEYEEGWKSDRIDPTISMTSEKHKEYLKKYAEFDEKFDGYFVKNPETGMQEWVFSKGGIKTPVFPNGGTRKRKPCNRRKKTRCKGSKGSKRMKKKNKAGKLKHKKSRITLIFFNI